jgi:hypothetical protein
VGLCTPPQRQNTHRISHSGRHAALPTNHKGANIPVQETRAFPPCPTTLPVCMSGQIRNPKPALVNHTLSPSGHICLQSLSYIQHLATFATRPRFHVCQRIRTTQQRYRKRASLGSFLNRRHIAGKFRLRARTNSKLSSVKPRLRPTPHIDRSRQSLDFYNAFAKSACPISISRHFPNGHLFISYLSNISRKRRGKQQYNISSNHSKHIHTTQV